MNNQQIADELKRLKEQLVTYMAQIDHLTNQIEGIGLDLGKALEFYPANPIVDTLLADVANKFGVFSTINREDFIKRVEEILPLVKRDSDEFFECCLKACKLYTQRNGGVLIEGIKMLRNLTDCNLRKAKEEMEKP